MGKKHTEERKPLQTKTPTFLLELPLVVQAGNPHACVRPELRRQFYNAVLSEGQRRLRRMRADPAWQGAHAIPRACTRSAKPPSRCCESATAFPSMLFMILHGSCGSRGWPSTPMRCWPRRLPPAPTGRSIGCVWARPAACALRVVAGGSIASRISATIRACALC